MRDLLQDAGEHGKTAWELSRAMKTILLTLKRLKGYKLVWNRGRDLREPYDGDHWILACYGGDTR